jgi:hypothetical protein
MGRAHRIPDNAPKEEVTLLCSFFFFEILCMAGIKNIYLRIGEGPEEYRVIPASELQWLQEK